MRICLASIHPRALSGQIETLVGLAKELRRLGHDVEVVSAFGSELVEKDRLTLGEGDDGFLLGKLVRIGGILENLRALSKSSDLIHLNLPTPAFAFLGDILQRFLSVPVVIGFEAHLAGSGHPIKLQDIWASPSFYLPRILVNHRLAARLTRHGAARYVVSSRFQAAELRSLGFPSGRISVLPNVVDMDKLQRIDQRDARRRLDLPGGPLVGYVGHYNHVKGADILAEAFGRLARRRKDAFLVLAWSGLGDPRPIERALRAARVDDRVFRLGRVSIGTFLSAIDVLALPYRYTMGQNAYPGLVLEAMAVGVPVVTSDLPLLRELLVHGRTGLLVTPRHASAVTLGIDGLLEDETLARQMVAEQRRVLGSSLNPKEVAKRYDQLYRQLCGREEALLQPAGSEPELRSPALRGAERGMGESARTECSAVAVATRREDS